MSLKINQIAPHNLSEILHSAHISESTKQEIIKNNLNVTSKSIQLTMSKAEYAALLKNRPLIKYKPLRNSFIKRGDKKMLSLSLGIPESEINKSIENIIETNFETTQSLSKDDISKIGEYLYRHGKQEHVLAYLNYQLSNAKDILETLYILLDDNLNGLAQYYSRPIHPLNNKTIEKIYIIVDENLKKAQLSGSLSQADYLKNSKTILKKIYKIQNNQKLINAKEIVG